MSSELQTIDELRAEVTRVRALIHRDQTGLAAALSDVVREASARLWVVDGRGAYAWNDDRYREETGLALRAVIEIAKVALGESGKLADSAFHPERPEPLAPTMVASVSTRLRELAHEARFMIEHRVFDNEADGTAWAEVRRRVRELGKSIEALLTSDSPPTDTYGFDVETVTRVDARGHHWLEVFLEDYSVGVQSWQECACGAVRRVDLPEAVYGRATELSSELRNHPTRIIQRGPHDWYKRLNAQSFSPCALTEVSGRS